MEGWGASGAWGLPGVGGKKGSDLEEAGEVGHASAGRLRTRVPAGAQAMDGGPWHVVCCCGPGTWPL